MTAQVNTNWIAARLVMVLTLAVTAPAVEAEQCRGAEPGQARQILSASGVKGGLIVHIGCGDGKLTSALGTGSSYLVHGLDGNLQSVETAREHIRSLGIYGRVSVEQYNGKRLPYADNLVNLVVSEDLGGVLMDEVVRVLCPLGAAYIKQKGQWTKTVKPRPKQMDEWTHYLHDATGNAVADDRLVGPPHHIQWVGGPSWGRSHDHLASVSAVVSAAGRILYIVDEGPIALVALPAKWSLVARDAFSGVVLWKRPVGPWEGHLRGFRSGPADLARRLVAVGDRVYVTLGYDKPLSALDAATGKTLKTYQATDGTTEIVYQDGMLLLVAGQRKKPSEDTPAAAWRRGVTPPTHKKRILVIEADTGKLLWKKSGAETADLMPTTLATSDGRVFFQNTEAVVCLDAKTGQRLWRTPRPVSLNRLGWSTPTLVVHGDVVLSADRQTHAAAKDTAAPTKLEWTPSSAGGNAPPGDLIAFSASSGKRLWSCRCRECYNAPVDVLVAGGLVWSGELVRAGEPGITMARDLLTGEVKKRRPQDATFFQVGMNHHRCYRNKATTRYLLLGRAGVEFIDLASGQAIAHHWVRGTCQYGVIPCNGLLYAPPHSCACYIRAKLNGFYALASKRTGQITGQEDDDRQRLKRGAAFGQVSNPQSPTADTQDWPTYRHDPARSGSTPSAVPAELAPRWHSELGGRLSSLVIAQRKVFAAQVDAHTLHALDADDGKPLWSYTAGGRIDSPPTIHKGLVLFGSADGYVYCLRVSDGRLVWRFRSGPEPRRVVAYGQVESAWPVHGSVLVQNDAAYFVAGRSAFLDGGMHLYRLDTATGKMLCEVRIDDRDPQTGLEPQEGIRGTEMPGALPDVLSSDGTSVFMRHKRFDLDGIEQEPNVPHLYSSVGFLDDTWWHRTYWMIGSKMRSGYGRWPIVGNKVPSGRILVFDESSIYGFGRDRYAHHGSHVGLDARTIFHFRPKRDSGTHLTRYHLFALERKHQTAKTAENMPAPKAAKKNKRGRPAQPPKKYRWSEDLPLLVRAMVLSKATLFFAGPPHSSSSHDLAAAIEGKKGGLLWAVSAGDAGKLAEYRLDSPPVFDGMAAAYGRLYIATTAGRLLCMGKK